MTWYNGKFNQCLSITVKADNHDDCLEVTKFIKKQCDAWAFNVRYDEHKSARKGPVLSRNLMIYQEAHASDILIFKEAIRRVTMHFEVYRDDMDIKFVDRGSEPVNDLRNQP